jgi:lysine decarboxylase
VPTDPRALRGDAPLLDAWLRFHEEPPTPFTIPGHKQRRDLVGDVVAGDVPLYAGLDTMKLTRGVLADAEQRAGRLWGAELCRFSVGGSTHGNQALALAVGRPGDRVVVARTLHRSMLLGLVLAGLVPVWVRTEVDPTHGLPMGVSPSAVETALRSAPDARAVFVGDPSYVGTVSDVAGLAAVAHRYDVPLVVDAAWGAHLGFHPTLPAHALAAGADALVTSAHKALPAWSQGAVVLASSRRISPGRFDSAVEATATTSPSGAILASIDAARALLERDGAALLGPVVEAVASVRRRLAEVPGLVVLDGPAVDPTRVVVVLPGTGADGNAVEADLLRGGNAGRDGRPRHRRGHGDARGHLAPDPGPRRGAGRVRRPPPWSRTPGRQLRGVGGRSGVRPDSAGGVLRLPGETPRRAGRRPGERGARRAVPAWHPRAGAG